eukprot:8087576-Pyramimonas_sp.AAC.1
MSQTMKSISCSRYNGIRSKLVPYVRSTEDGHGQGKPDDEVNLWPFFAANVFSGYGETGKGFYSVYGELFGRLLQQEIELGEEEEVDFGGPSSSAEEG